MCENDDVIRMRITSIACSLRGKIANYWPGMHNTTFLVIFADRFELSPLREKPKLFHF